MLRSRFLKYFTLYAVIFLFLLAFYSFGKSVKKKWIVYITLNSPHWQERNEEINHIESGKYKIIFLGNSLTELFDLDYYFKDSAILNCGIVGDFTEGLIVRANSIIRLKPKKLFIEIGINDMIEQISLDEICCNYKNLIEKIKNGSPDTKIFIQSNLPVIINRPSLFTNDKYVNDLIKKQNYNLKELAKETNCVYIDIYSELVKDSDKIFIWDGVHLTDKGYGIWKKTVFPYVVSSDKDK